MKTLDATHIKNLKDLIKNNPQFTTHGSKLGDFFNLYLVCEVLARRLVKYYYGKDKKELLLSNIKTACNNYFSLKVSPTDINRIFKSKNGKKEKKSCRQLRNRYLHFLSNNEKQEIETRYLELETLMKDWINIFSSL